MGSGFVPRVFYWLPFGIIGVTGCETPVDSCPGVTPALLSEPVELPAVGEAIPPTFSSDFSEAASEEKLMLIRSVPEGRMDASAARFAHQAIYAFSRRPLRHPSRPHGSRAVDLSPLPGHSKRRGERGRFWRKRRLSPGSEVRLDLFATPSVNVHNLRTDGWGRRKAAASVMLFLPVVPQQERAASSARAFVASKDVGSTGGAGIEFLASCAGPPARRSSAPHRQHNALPTAG